MRHRTAALISVEGIDGAGKNTLVSAVEQQLEQQGLRVGRLSFPAYRKTLFADLADDALHGRLGDVPNSAWAMALLFALDRRDMAGEIAHYLEAYDVVLCDRYVASNAAYSWARTSDRNIVDFIGELEFDQFGLPVPQLQIYLDVSADLAAYRAMSREQQDRSRTRDAYERDSSLQQATSEAYRALCAMSWRSPWYRCDGDVAATCRKITSVIG